MQMPRKTLMLSALGCFLLLSNCTQPQTQSKPEVVEKVVIQTKTVTKPKPIVPSIEPLNLRDINWVVITPTNAEEKLSALGEGAVFFAITADGYKALQLNLADVRAVIDKQKAIIVLYEKSF